MTANDIAGMVDALEAEALLSGEHRDERHVRRRLAARAALDAAIAELVKERDGLREVVRWAGNHFADYKYEGSLEGTIYNRCQAALEATSVRSLEAKPPVSGGEV